MKKVKIVTKDLAELEAALDLRAKVDYHATVKQAVAAKERRRDALGIDARPYHDHVSATFRPEIIPPHIRDKMKADRDKARSK